MPRAPDGSYSLPNGTLVNSGDTLLVSQHNPPLSDIAAALSGSLSRDGLGGMRARLSMGGFPIQNLLPGVNSGDAATVGQLAIASATPPGVIADFAGGSAPDGWLLCGGQSVNRADYPALFAVIGTTYGSASGSTFNLPDCRGRVTAGRDFDQGGNSGRLSGATMTPNGLTLGATGGAQSVALTTGQLANHTHTGTTASAGAHTHSVENSGSANAQPGGGLVGSTVGGLTGSAGAHTHTFTTDATGSGEAHLNVQPTILFNKIIRY